VKKHMNNENFLNPKWANSEKYQDSRIRIKRDLATFAKEYYNFEKYGSYRELLSEIIERELLKMFETVKANPVKIGHIE
jgi:hypothetical protein